MATNMPCGYYSNVPGRRPCSSLGDGAREFLSLAVPPELLLAGVRGNCDFSPCCRRNGCLRSTERFFT